MRGTVKRLQRDKGFGFIRDKSGTEYFFHRSACRESTDAFAQLQEGQSVDFDTEESPKGPRAANVRSV